MEYRFWDMDHTICNNDCDVSWKEFLFATGRAPADDQKLVDHYYELYEQNALPFEEFIRFQLKEFAGGTPEEMAELCQEHFDTVVQPKIYPKAEAMIREQLAAGDGVCLLTATNAAVAAPLAAYLGIPDMIATQLELINGVYTGEIAGVYCCGPGKVTCLDAYCGPLAIAPEDVWYYGDSTSDQYVLGHVGHPVATNPSDLLRAMAEEKGWDVQELAQAARYGIQDAISKMWDEEIAPLALGCAKSPIRDADVWLRQAIAQIGVKDQGWIGQESPR